MSKGRIVKKSTALDNKVKFIITLAIVMIMLIIATSCNVPEEVIINYITDGGETLSPAVINGEYQLPATLNREGYTFLGWYSNAEFTGESITSIKPAGVKEINLYAKWAINVYIISFELNYNATIESISQDYNTDITLPTPVRPAYTFDGWYTDNTTFNTAFTATTMPVDGATLYAKWTYTPSANTLAITANDIIYGSALNISVDTNTSSGALTYEYKLQSEGDSAYTATLPVTVGDYTVRVTSAATGLYHLATATANFKINKATYDMSGASWIYAGPFVYDGTSKMVYVTGLPAGIIVSGYSGNIRTHAGNYLAGITFNYDYVNYNAPVMAPINWVINKATYDMTNVSWNYIGAFIYDGTPKSVTVTDLPAGVTVNSYTDNTKTDAGNYTASIALDYDNENYNEPVVASTNWSIMHVITFDSNGASGIMEDQYAISGVAVNLSPNTFTMDDYVFLGWSLTINGGVNYHNCASFLASENVHTLYAVFNDQFTEGLLFTLNDDETGYSVSKGTAGDNVEIIIPPIYNRLPVTEIAYEGFRDCINLTNIYIPDSITVINEYAFSNCSNLTDVILPDSVTVIGDWAFLGCIGITSITFSEYLLSIGAKAFSITGLISVSIPSNIETIGYNPFVQCLNLVNINVSLDNINYKDIDGVLYSKDGKSILSYPAGKSEESYTVSDGVEEIGVFAFGYSQLKYIYIPEGVLTLNMFAFSSCEALIGINIPSTVTSFGPNAFLITGALSYINISAAIPPAQPSHIDITRTNIYVLEAYLDDYKLAWSTYEAGILEMPTVTFDVDGIEIYSIELPYNSKVNKPADPSSDDGIFIGWLDENDQEFDFNQPIISNVTIRAEWLLYTIDLQYDLLDDESGYAVKKGSATDSVIVIPPMHQGLPVKEIGWGGFWYSVIDRIILPNTIEKISDFAFYCSSLTEINLPEGLNHIGDWVFVDCLNLTNVILPLTLTYIGEGSFWRCSILYIDIPSNVTYIGESSFISCDYLQAIEINIDNQYYKSIEGVLYNKSCDTLLQYPSAKTGSHFTLPNSVINIASYAFYNTVYLETVTLNDGLDYIGYEAFSGCNNLSNITFPDSLTYIDDYVFYNCTSLTDVMLSSNLTIIGENAFEECISLASITGNSDNYKTMDGVLFNSDYTTLLLYPASRTNIEYIVPEGVEELNDNAFVSCIYLSNVILPSTLTRIGCWNFSNCNFDLSITLLSHTALSYGCYIFSYYNGNDYVILDNLEIWVYKYVYDFYLNNLSNYADYIYAMPEVNFITNGGSAVPNLDVLLGGRINLDNVNTLKDDSTFRGWYRDEDLSIEFDDNDEIYGDLTLYAGWTLGTDGLQYSLINNETEYAVVVPYNGVSRNVFVPLEYNGLPVTLIGSSAFEHSKIMSVVLSDNVREISSGAFNHCEELIDVTLSANLEKIYMNAFGNCYSLTSIIIPDSVVTLWSDAFYRCYSLEHVTLSNNITSIDVSTFRDNFSLTYIILPQSISSIGGGAFLRDGGLNDLDVYVLRDIPPIIGPMVFYIYYESVLSILSNLKIWVPKSSVDAYKSSWSEYVDYIFAMPEVTFDSNGGSDVNSQNIPHNKTASQPEDPVWEGQEFIAWYTDIGLTVPYDFSTPVGEDITLYAKWVTTGLQYDLINEDTEYSVGIGSATAENIFIPSSYEGKPVTAISENGFSNSNIVNVSIPDFVTIIKGYAFSNCIELSNIIIPDSVLEISESAFNKCSSLSNVILSNSLSIIGRYAFYECSELINILIPDSVTEIGETAFHSCTSIINIIIPDSVLSLGDSAFYNCTSLISVTIGTGLSQIPELAFYGCISLLMITIPDNVEYVGISAFGRCSSLSVINLSEGLITIDELAFSEIAITAITIPESVEYIGEGAISYCNYLINISVPLDNLYYQDIDGVLFSKDGTELLAFPTGKTMSIYVVPWSVITICPVAFFGVQFDYLYIQEGVITIGMGAFGASSIEGIYLPSTITSIDEYAFAFCNIEYVNILATTPPAITSLHLEDMLDTFFFVPSLALSDYQDIWSEYALLIRPMPVVTFDTDGHQDISPADVPFGTMVQEPMMLDRPYYDFIGWYADDLFETPFDFDSEIIEEDITIYAHWEATAGTDGLIYSESSGELTVTGYNGTSSSVFVPLVNGGKPVVAIAADAFLDQYDIVSIVIAHSVTSIGSSAFTNCTNLESVIIPGSVTILSESLFMNCTNLTSVTLPNIITIEANAFNNCTGLTSIDLPDTLITIGLAAFFNCTSLSFIDLRDSLITIGESAFEDCQSLTTITIPNSVTSIEACAFWGTGLTSIVIPHNITVISGYLFMDCYDLITVTMHDNITAINEYAFFNCFSLVNITLPANLTYIGNHSFACSGLTAITLPDGVTEINDNTFYYCEDLASVILPSGLLSINNSAFADCNSLTNIIIPDSVTYIGVYAFHGYKNSFDITMLRAIPSIIGSFAFADTHPLKIWVLRSSLAAYETSWSEYIGYFYQLPQVTFDTDGGSVIDAQDVIFNNYKAIRPDDPEKEHYDFAGWYADELCITPFDFDNLITTHTIIYAKWTDTIYTISFESNGGNEIEDIEATFGASISAPDDPVRAGCTFEGWYDISLTTEYVFDTMPDNYITVYAKWDILPGTDGLQYLLNNNEYIITGYTGTDVDIIIPVEYNGLPVTIIGTEAFRVEWPLISPITSLTIYGGIREIGISAFFACSNLTSVTLGRDITYIARDAFVYCEALPSIVIPIGVTYIGREAFYKANSSTTIYCEALSKPEGWDNLWSSGSTVIWSSDGIERTYYFETNGGSAIDPITSYNVNMQVTLRDGYYFTGWYDNSMLEGTPLSFPYFSKTNSTLYASWNVEVASGFAIEGITYDLIDGKYEVIGYSGTSKDIFVPSTHNGLPVRSINYQAFYNKDIETLIIGNGIETIGTEAFNSCASLTSVIIGNGVTTIGYYAFKYCTNLVSLTIGDSVTIINSEAFAYCESLISIVLPEGLTEISESLFEQCTSLTSVILGSNITSIGNYAFDMCLSLTNIIIPSSVTYIGYAGLISTRLSFLSEIPAELHSTTSILIYSTLEIYVPANSVDTYKAATYWSNFANYIFAMPIVTFDTDGGSTVDPVNVPYNSAVNEPLDPEKDGYYFDGWYTDEFFTTPFDFDTLITANTIIYAKWSV